MLLAPFRKALARLAAAVALIGGAWLAGRRGAKQAAKTERAEANAKAAKDAKDNRHELENSDDQRLVDILTGRVRK